MASSPQQSTPFAEKAVVLVPTCNPGAIWPDFLQGIRQQKPAPAKVVILDSESTDGQVQAASDLHVHTIARASFNHGATRQEGIDRFAADAEFVVFLTQDALLTDPAALETLLSAFADPQVAAVYGRQLPHANATPVAAHARLFNYPERDYTVKFADRTTMGLRACFFSNSFAAYRVRPLQDVGGFASNVVLGEDMQLVARLLRGGYTVAYRAAATVYHSHNYSLAAEFSRYFDTGVFQASQKEMLQDFGPAGKEGFKYVKSEIKFLSQRNPWLIPEALIRNVLKLLAFRLGRFHASFPLAMRRSLSMHKGYWN